MNEKINNWVIRMTKQFKLSDGHFLTLEAIANSVNTETGIGRTSIGYISESRRIKVCYNTVMSHIEFLAKKKIISKQQHARLGVPRKEGSTKTYALNDYLESKQ